MKCPRCLTENGNRTICSKCGYYMYHPDIANRVKLTRGQRAKEDARIIGKGIWRVVKIAWMILTVIVMSALIIALLMYLTGGTLG